MKHKKLVLSLVIGILLIFSIITGASFYMLNYSLTPQDNCGKNISDSFNSQYKDYPFIKRWCDSLQQVKALKDTFIYASDGTRLHALFTNPRKTKKTALIIHGYTVNSVRMLMIGYLYHHDLDYNILLPDLRDHGLSGGNRIQMGWKDRIDIIRWINIAQKIYGDSIEMVIHGISMGAATTMMVSGEKQPSYVKCFVEDCGYTSVWDQFAKELKSQFKLPAFPLMYTSSFINKIFNGWSFQEASSLNQVKKCKLPMFFIHGSSDTYVPTWMVYTLYKAKSGDKKLWVVPNATHAMSYHNYPKEYTEKVKDFTDKYIR